ncbi:hypothetical protein TNCV_3244501 [Trichonephila clavipes]|nr:hypothetical protein TNCV_3244501 [Trichonephila clavipes]
MKVSISICSNEAPFSKSGTFNYWGPGRGATLRKGRFLDYSKPIQWNGDPETSRVNTFDEYPLLLEIHQQCEDSTGTILPDTFRLRTEKNTPPFLWCPQLMFSATQYPVFPAECSQMH